MWDLATIVKMNEQAAKAEARENLEEALAAKRREVIQARASVVRAAKAWLVADESFDLAKYEPAVEALVKAITDLQTAEAEMLDIDAAIQEAGTIQEVQT